MPVYRDQTGRTISLPSVPRRIVSIVPSQTELLFDLGLRDEVVGITRFCIHPDEWSRSKTRVGGTKQLHTDIIYNLQPDLILANKEENVKEQVEELALHYPVWVSDINELEGALDMITRVGLITGTGPAARKITARIENDFRTFITPLPRRKACYLIWKNPYMTVGSDTFIHHLLGKAGFENVFANRQRYPAISLEEIRAAAPEFLLLSSEPFPFAQKHIDELQPLLPGTKIIIVDGEMFSWYGSRLLLAADYFRELWKAIN